MYQCSECGRSVGAFLDREGKPTMFKCPRTGEPATTIPEFMPKRKAVKQPKWLDGEDLSQRATKQKKVRTNVSANPWGDQFAS